MARPRGFDEDDIITKARDAFLDHGYAATSVEQLTTATGLGKGSLYGAFGDKHGLFIRVFGDYCEDEMAGVERELAGEGALSRLEAHFAGKLAGAPPPGRGCLLAKETAELASEDLEVRRMATRAYARYEEALKRCVTRAQDEGEVRAELDPARTAAHLLAVLRGIEALGRADHPAASLKAATDGVLDTLRA